MNFLQKSNQIHRVDDIEDNSQLRRGKPCAHFIFGTASTINSANFMYFEALDDARKHLQNSSQSLSVLIDELLLLHKGQAMDIYWRDNLVCPTEEEYITMVENSFEIFGFAFFPSFH